MKIAVPVINGQINQHFGHSDQFAVFNTAGASIKDAVILDTPDQGHAFIPEWLDALEVSVVLADGMGVLAQQALAKKGIQVVGSVEGMSPRTAVEHYLNGTLPAHQPVCGGRQEVDKKKGAGSCECGGQS